MLVAFNSETVPIGVGLETAGGPPTAELPLKLPTQMLFEDPTTIGSAEVSPPEVAWFEFA